jgi:hypothetical protein
MVVTVLSNCAMLALASRFFKPAWYGSCCHNVESGSGAIPPFIEQKFVENGLKRDILRAVFSGNYEN